MRIFKWNYTPVNVNVTADDIFSILDYKIIVYGTEVVEGINKL